MEIISGAVAGGGERLSSQNLRDLLRIKDEYHHHNLNQTTSSNGGGTGGGNNPPGLTLEAVLRDKRGPPSPEVADEPLQRVQSNRTLLDIIREDQTSGFGGRGRSRRSWRHLKDKIRLPRRGAAAYSSSVRIPVSDVPLNNNHQIHRASARFNSNTNSSESTQHDIPGDLDTNSSRLGPTSSLPGRLITEDNHRIILDEDEQHGVDDTVEAGEQPVRMSLMALLAENDRQMGLEGSAYTMDEDQEGEDQDEETITTDGAAVHGGEYNNCCVCMVRHKGAAFIPCGHTFCRLCSRELWVKRGNCPLCNNYISEILDIF